MDQDQFETIVIGGSDYKKTVFQVNKESTNESDKLSIISSSLGKNPKFETKEIFLEFIETLLERDISNIALNFAYPLDSVFRDNKVDGKLLMGKKENNFEGFIENIVGLEIEEYICKTQNRNINVSVANDTICLLLSGIEPHHKKLELVSGIVGTGINFAFFLDHNDVVNTEAANFKDFPQSKTGIIIDKESKKPGHALIEKEISGAYLYKHFNLIILEKGIKDFSINSTEELENVIKGDNAIYSDIAKDVIKHSAQLTAALIAGIVKFKNSDLIFIMEGSLFWKGIKYKKIVEETLKDLVKDFKVTFIYIENSSTIGAQKLLFQ